MPRDWPDPRWPPHKPVRWWEIALASVGLVAFVASILAMLLG
jgi:hypothetical protein